MKMNSMEVDTSDLYWSQVTFNFFVSRFSFVDPGNIVRLLAPDICLLCSTLFILKLCKKLLRPLPQISLHENGIRPSDPEVTMGTFIML